jgi:multidrug efflux pump subunit AcrA (membrane-fusion protein)
MEDCEGKAVIVEPPDKAADLSNGPAHVVRRRPQWLRRGKAPAWRRRGVLFAGLGILLVAVVILGITRSQSAPAAPTATPATAPLIAHGQIVPAQQARVGTQAGGVLQRLEATPGQTVNAQTPLAWVAGPTSTEVVTAPFGGVITNVLVHAGDTLMPGAPIAVVADMHVLQVETSDVDEFLVSHVAPGQQVQISVDALDNRALNGTVTSVALLPQTGASGGPAYPVVISIGGLPTDVRPGMSVRVTFPDQAAPQ